MSTNYTHLINENLDQFDDSECIGIAEQIALDEEYEREQEEVIWWEIDDHDWQVLYDSERRLREIIERCGQYGEDEFQDEWGFYSDWYKDLYGFRPRWFRW